MAVKNPWVLPAAVLILIGVLGLSIFGSRAISGASQLPPHQRAVSILRVPGEYGTIQAAINAAKPGDTIEVAAGTYTENLLLNKPVSLVAASFDEANAANNATIIDGGSGQSTILVPSELAQSPIVRGFVIRNSRDGIEAYSSFVAQNDYFYGSQMSVEYQPGAGGVNRDNVYFNSANDAIHIDDMRVPLLIQNNRFLYAGDDSIEVDLQAASSPPPLVEIDIWDNMLIGSSQDGIKFVDYASGAQDANRRIMVAGNLIANNRRAGIGFMHSGNTNEDYSGAETAEAVRVYNNTLYGNDYGVSGGGNAVLFNNIIANSSSLGTWRVQSPPGGNSVVAYTLFFNNRVDMDQTLVGPGDILAQDPLFVAPPNPGRDKAWGTVDDDFSGLLLRPGSPAVDKGVTQYRTASGELVPPAPLTGYVGAAPDLGWRELGSALFMTPTAVVTAVPQTNTSPTAAIPATSTPTVNASVTPAATGTAKPATTLTPGAPATTETPSLTSTPAITSTPMVILQSISPATVKANTTVTVTIKGLGFENGVTVAFEGVNETPPRVTNVQVVDPTTITADVNALDDLQGSDAWSLRVTNPDGTTAILFQAFTVTP